MEPLWNRSGPRGSATIQLRDGRAAAVSRDRPFSFAGQSMCQSGEWKVYASLGPRRPFNPLRLSPERHACSQRDPTCRTILDPGSALC